MRSPLSQFMHRSSEEGLTLIESLVAIVIIGIVLAAIAPPLLIAAATRVQNQRTEQAMQLAQGEVNRVRLIVGSGNYKNTDLPPVVSEDIKKIEDTPAPAKGTNGYTLDDTQVSINRGLAINVNREVKGNKLDCKRDSSNQCIPDFVVQVFRDAGVTPTGESVPIAFRMGVRVYDYQSLVNGASSPLKNERASLGLTSQRNLERPLAVLYTTVSNSERGNISLEQYHQLLKPSK
ncbi:prepilin-type N-terminal cleavage/methylation domain-containing protein [Gloeocapsopsis sp. IPPAS B-1203]|uniref:prepilin-type N-terminal cleavage/methylation domain-containing protein n=1 Tax=Gloeocapsopsis sp. IPPAS B-1203 TaxID=2049454 RepID=UPI000C191EC2|nr:prepilin-type N-terminal cleavage/methylation domain-containing protein [Gloeocapsopsis sp. IPPAS B-1203]PIG91374.1 hypothetical protein CSQ79_22060 [Gloeocapsopsis sp. IPPAS B-1203]